MLDVAVIVVLAVFGVVGLISGMLFQVLRLGAVVASVAVGLSCTGPAMEMFPFLGRLPANGEGLVPAALFLASYLVLSLLSRLVVKALHAASPDHGLVDRLLGGLFGALKGAVLCYFIVAILLAAEVSAGRSLRYVDTHDSVAAEFVRAWPVGRLKGLLDQAELEVLPVVRDALKMDALPPEPPSPEGAP